MNNERQLDRVLEGAFCPEAAVLGQFLDESLSADLQERVAGHVLRCCACQDVVAWTREAAAQPLSQRKSKTATGRRRRIRPAAKQGLPSWVPGVAAAAGLLLVAFVALKASDTQPSGQLGQATPSASPTPSKIQPQPSPSRATPRPTTAPSLRPSLPSPTPQASVRPTPAASPGAT
ncbi:MAG: hypothetical protein JKY65_20155, partial [Planctomycetes bacterium]|nr:hypothetical protein [Planctomycetota bacterium]